MRFLGKFSSFGGLCISLLVLQPPNAHAQTHRDSVRKVYYVNPWVSGGISAAGALAGLLSIPIRAKPNITDSEFGTLNRNNIPSFDRWVLNIDPSNIGAFENYSLAWQAVAAAAPLGLLLDDDIRQQWGDILLMALEVNAVAIAIYAASPLGPSFQTRYRPVVYLDQLSYDARRSGQNKNSFYSGHVASCAASTFFTATVYSDYHPEIGADKYWLYGAALVPPVIMGYLRFHALDHFLSDELVGLAVGTACGIVIPELHRIGGSNASLGVYTSPEATGLAVRWTLEGNPQPQTEDMK